MRWAAQAGAIAVIQFLSCVRLFVTPRTVAHQVPLSMRFSRQEYWNGLPFSSLEDLPRSGIEPTSPALAGGFFTTEPWEAHSTGILTYNFLFFDILVWFCYQDIAREYMYFKSIWLH